MTDEEAAARIKELSAILKQSEKSIDATRVWLLLLELRSYSDTKGRVIPASVFGAMGDEMRMLAFDSILACLAAVTGLALPDKTLN